MMKEQANMPTTIALTDEELESMRGGCHHDDDCDRGDDDDRRCFRDDFCDDGRRFSYEESYSFRYTSW